MAPEVLAAACVQLAGHMACLGSWQLQDQAACTATFECNFTFLGGTDMQLLMDVEKCLCQAARQPLPIGLACQLGHLLQQKQKGSCLRFPSSDLMLPLSSASQALTKQLPWCPRPSRSSFPLMPQALTH